MRSFTLATLVTAVVSVAATEPEVALGQNTHRNRDAIPTAHIGMSSAMGQEVLHRMGDSLALLVFFRMEDPLAIKALKQAKKLWRAYRGRGLKVFGVHSPPRGWHAARPPREEHIDTGPHPLEGQSSTPGIRSEPVQHLNGRPLRQLGVNNEVARLRTRKQYADPMTSLTTRHGIPFPIMLDHDNAIWRRYGLISYPAFLHIQSDGKPVSGLTGAIPYSELSHITRQLLHE
jgi:hypothetical protein